MEPSPSEFHEPDLSKGMAHMRTYVSVPTRHSPAPTKPAHSSPGEDAVPPPSLSTLSLNDPTVEPNSVYGVPSSAINPARHGPDSARPTENNPLKRSDPFQFGSRLLTDADDIFEFNAWDHVQLDPAFASFADEQFAFQREHPVSDFDKARFNRAPEKWWNTFYAQNTTNFFKDRKWLFQEFPTLAHVARPTAGPKVVLEVGAGAGNTAFPVVDLNQNPELRIWACDYAKKAVELMRNDARCDGERCRAEVWDVASSPAAEADEATAAPEEAGTLPPGMQEGTIDVVVLIFIFSALAPDQWRQALWNVWRALKPGGEILLRDYGRGDLAQVRFKKGRYLDENFYIRGDGTRVYFFEEEQLRKIFTGKMAEEDQQKWPEFETVNLGTDRRMLVNRQRKLKMYRCWMQGRFRKPGGEAAAPTS